MKFRFRWEQLVTRVFRSVGELSHGAGIADKD